MLLHKPFFNFFDYFRVESSGVPYEDFFSCCLDQLFLAIDVLAVSTAALFTANEALREALTIHLEAPRTFAAAFLDHLV